MFLENVTDDTGVTDATDATDATYATDATDATVATVATDATGATDATDATDATNLMFPLAGKAVITNELYFDKASVVQHTKLFKMHPIYLDEALCFTYS